MTALTATPATEVVHVSAALAALVRRLAVAGYIANYVAKANGTEAVAS